MQNDFYKELRNLVVSHEDLKRFPYLCPRGKNTIGVGRNLDDNGISEHEALYMLHNDLCRVGKELHENVRVMPVLSKPRQMALIDMCFNLGLTRFLTFKKMLAALEAGDYQKAADEMLDSKWAGEVGLRAQNLAYMMRNG